MIDFLKDKVKYLKEPYRLRVHLGYILILIFTATANPYKLGFIFGTLGLTLGIVIRAWASGIVKKNEELATEGPYSLCRNPLYVGNILIGLSFAMIHGSWWSYGALSIYLLLFYPYTIRRESRHMRDLFGDEFDQYQEAVPALIPRLTPYDTLSGWSFEQYFVKNKDVVNESIVILCWAYTCYRYVM